MMRNVIYTTKTLIMAAALMLACPAVLCFGQENGKAKKIERLTISKATTYITGPVNADGTVNYVAYLNAKYSKGVTPGNNAKIPLLKAIGPGAIDERIRVEVYKRLGMKPLDETGDYFQPLREYLQARGLKKSKIERIREQFEDKARSQPWQKRDMPEIAAWLRANEKPLAMFTAASKRKRYYWPLVCVEEPGKDVPDNVISAITSPFNGYRQCARVLTARAMMHLGEGDADAAFDDAMTARRVARLVAASPNLIAGLVGMAIDKVALDTINVLSASRQLDAIQTRAMLLEMQSLKPLPSYVSYLEVDRLMVLECVMLLVRQKESPVKTLARICEYDLSVTSKMHTQPLKLDWDLMLRQVNYWLDLREASFAKPKLVGKQAISYLDLINRIQREQQENLDKSVNLDADLLRLAKPGCKDEKLRMRVSQIFIDAIVVVLLPSTGRVEILLKRLEVDNRLANVAMALGAYRADAGKYPAELADLTPGYLKTIPRDPYASAKALKYRRKGKGYIIYSLGKNKKDDGGKHDYDDGDIAVKAK